jgi:hypothetical protein
MPTGEPLAVQSFAVLSIGSDIILALLSTGTIHSPVL